MLNPLAPDFFEARGGGGQRERRLKPNAKAEGDFRPNVNPMQTREALGRFRPTEEREHTGR